MKSSNTINELLAEMGVTVHSRNAQPTQNTEKPIIPTSTLTENTTPEPTKTQPEATPAAPAVTEGVRQVLKGGRLVRQKTQKHSAAERAKWRQAAHKPGAKAARKKLLKKPATKRKARLRAALQRESVETPVVPVNPSSSKVDAVISEAEALLASHKAAGQDLTLKGFAEIALNADLLSRAFRVFGEAYKNDDIKGLSTEYELLADQANAIVENLQADLRESTELPNNDHLLGAYNSMVDVIMDASEFYEVIGEELAEEAERAGASLGN